MTVVLSKYTLTCARNITGNKQLFIAAAADVTSATVTSSEISAVTATAASFVNVGFEQDSYNFTQVAAAQKNQMSYEKTHTFRLGKAQKENNTFIDLLSDNLACGFLVIRGDNNAIISCFVFHKNYFKN